MAYTDAQGRPELIAGEFLKKSSGSATTSKDRGDDTQKDSPAKTERKPEAGR